MNWAGPLYKNGIVNVLQQYWPTMKGQRMTVLTIKGGVSSIACRGVLGFALVVWQPHHGVPKYKTTTLVYMFFRVLMNSVRHCFTVIPKTISRKDVFINFVISLLSNQQLNYCLKLRDRGMAIHYTRSRAFETIVSRKNG